MALQEDILALAQQQGLDPQILEMAMQYNGMNGGLNPQMQATKEMVAEEDMDMDDILASSPIMVHAEEMADLLQQSTQDEVLAFVAKIIEMYQEMK